MIWKPIEEAKKDGTLYFLAHVDGDVNDPFSFCEVYVGRWTKTWSYCGEDYYDWCSLACTEERTPTHFAEFNTGE